jgi:hypothetical protein
VQNPFQDQPLGYVEPDYEGIDGLAWAWSGGSDRIENVVGGIAPHFDYYAGWRNPGAASADRLNFLPERAVPMTSGADYTFEYIGVHISRSASATPSSMVAVGDPEFATQSIGFGLVGSTGGLGVTTATTGFQGYNSGLAPAAALHHFIVSRYRSRMFAWLYRYDTDAVSRNLDTAPPSSAMVLAGPPVVTLIKPRSTTTTMVAEIYKAAIYTRGMPEAEAEALLRDPWITFKTRRSRIDTILQPVVSAFNPAWAQRANRYIGSGIHVS